MIGTVIKTVAGKVMVFDEKGEQMPDYQGDYSTVKDKVLTDAPAGANFFHEGVEGETGDSGILEPKQRKEW